MQKAVEGEITDAVAASFLQHHPDATFFSTPPPPGNLRPFVGRG